MLEKIMDLVKGQVTKTVDGMAEVPEDKKQETVETTAHSLVDNLKQYATPENIAALTSMLGISKSATAPAASATPAGDMAANLESGVVSALTSKVGLNGSVAQKIATTVIPAVMSLFKKKVDDDNEPEFNLGSLVGSLTGGKSGTGSNLMGMLGNLMGNK